MHCTLRTLGPNRSNKIRDKERGSAAFADGEDASSHSLHSSTYCDYFPRRTIANTLRLQKPRACRELLGHADQTSASKARDFQRFSLATIVPIHRVSSIHDLFEKLTVIHIVSIVHTHQLVVSRCVWK